MKYNLIWSNLFLLITKPNIHATKAYLNHEYYRDPWIR